MLSGAASAEERPRLEHRLLGVRAGRRGVQRRPLRRRSPTRRSTRCSPRGGGRSSSAGPGSTCAPRWPTSSCVRRCRPRSAAEVEREIAERGAGGASRRARPGARRGRASQRPQADRPPDRADSGSGIEPHMTERGAVDRAAAPPDPAGRPDRRPRAARPRGSTRGSTRWSPPAPPTEVRRADAAGASRTARAAIGFDQLLAGDVEAMKARPARLRPAPADLDAEDAGRRADRPRRPRRRREVAAEIVARARIGSIAMRFEKWQALGNDYVIVEARGAALGADRRADPAHLRAALRDRLGRDPAALAPRATTATSPSCGSSTPTAPRPSCPATGRARRCSTCAPPAGPTRTRSRS